MTKTGQSANVGPPPALPANERNKYSLCSKDAPAHNAAAQKQQGTLAATTSTASSTAKQPPLLRLFSPFPLPRAYLPEPRSYSPSCQPRHLPFHCHTSLRHHLPTWLFFILISDSDSLCLPPYLRRYCYPLWQAPPRPFLYLTLASTTTKP